jgi:hypothetical protein
MSLRAFSFNSSMRAKGKEQIYMLYLFSQEENSWESQELEESPTRTWLLKQTHKGNVLKLGIKNIFSQSIVQSICPFEHSERLAHCRTA